MSKLSQKRKQVNYKISERCENCTDFKKSNRFLRNSLPVTTATQCGRFGFTINKNAICDFYFPKETP